MEEETIKLMRYNAAWFWHIIAWMFFVQAVVFLIQRDYLWMAGFVGVFLFAEIMALVRKSELEKLENGVEA